MFIADASTTPYIYGAIFTPIGTAIAFVGKQVIKFINDTLQRSNERGDRLEKMLFETQALVMPAVEASNNAIQQFISLEKKA